MADVYLVGVGGQGIITASKIIGDAALLAGEKVILSETHGMAQRGGSVVCTARIGDRTGPLIPDMAADVILSLELLETLRAECKASKDDGRPQLDGEDRASERVHAEDEVSVTARGRRQDGLRSPRSVIDGGRC